MARPPSAHQEVIDFIDDLRVFLGKKPLPKESIQSNETALKVTLDGVRFMSAKDWAKHFRVTRQCIDNRLKAIERRKALGAADPYRRVEQYKKRARRYLQRMNA